MYIHHRDCCRNWWASLASNHSHNGEMSLFDIKFEQSLVSCLCLVSFVDVEMAKINCVVIILHPGERQRNMAPNVKIDYK